MRRLTLLAAATAAVALPLLAATPAAAEPRCYTLGVPGQDAYQVCRYLPVDPNEIITP